MKREDPLAFRKNLHEARQPKKEIAATTSGEQYLTPEQIASMLQITERTVYRWLDAGQLRGVKLGRLWRIKPTDYEAFLAVRFNTNEQKTNDFSSTQKGVE